MQLEIKWDEAVVEAKNSGLEGAYFELKVPLSAQPDQHWINAFKTAATIRGDPLEASYTRMNLIGGNGRVIIAAFDGATDVDALKADVLEIVKSTNASADAARLEAAERARQFSERSQDAEAQARDLTNRFRS